MTQHLTKTGTPYIIRQANENDAENLIQYSKIVFASTDQLLTTPEEYTISVTEQKTWIENIGRSANSKLLVAVLNGSIVGFLFFTGQQKMKHAHIGELGVNVHPDYRGAGIGRALMETIIKWVAGNNTIEKIVLQVFSTNYSAIKLYHSLGFKEEGRFAKAIKQKDGEYVDLIQMCLFVAKD